jgi:pyridoxal phosphate enzyme (YggS family)
VPNEGILRQIQQELSPKQVRIVAVSKMQSVENIMKLYEQGQRDFGENYVQELLEKAAQLPKDIRWHFIGHLQSNKVKQITSFIHTIHSIDSLKLLGEVDRQAASSARTVDCLLQVNLSKQATKFGMEEKQVSELAREICGHPQEFEHIGLTGLMGMATLTAEESIIRAEFRKLKELLLRLKEAFFGARPGFRELSMGMSADYRIAVEEGATMVRLGSLLFGART